MHLKKRLIAVAAVLVMAAAVLYGSTFVTGDTEETDGPLTWGESKETIYIWYSDDNMTNFIDSAAVAFGEREGVRVIPVLTSESEYLEAISHASAGSVQVPDVYLISHDSLEKAYLAGLATQIQDMEGICNEANFPQAALSAVSYQGMRVAYPLCFETSALICNETYLREWASQSATKELLEAGEAQENPGEDSSGIEVDPELLAQKTESYFQSAVPATVDDLRNIADSFDVPEGVEGVMEWDVSDIFYNYWIVGNYMIVGGDAGDDASRIDINNPETIQCLEVYQALNQFFSMESDSMDYETVIDDFCQGRVVFTIATTDVAARLEQAKANGEIAFDYRVAPLPQISADLKSRTMSVTTTVAVNSYSEHEELANRFASYLVGECAQTLYDRAGKVPAKLGVGEENAALQIFKQVYGDSIPLPKMMETGNFWVQLESLFSKVWNGADVTTLVQELAGQIQLQIDASR
ncbi:MAG: extracellular solute-binding protein [Lachnospiraceae bacterium]|nr:extracellular solute-binding protein [Lachnospiraceae bacterium]